MSRYSLLEMRRQLARLPEDAAELVKQAADAWPDALTRRPVRRLIVLGSGDSYCAAQASVLAFARAGIAATAALPAGLVRHPELAAVAGYDLAVLVSASGSSPSVVDAGAVLRNAGVPTVALTGQPGSSLAQVCDRVAGWSLHDLAPSPGIRTYQAALIMLLGLSIRLGAEPEPSWHADALAGAVADCIRAAQEQVPGVVELVAAGQPPLAPMFAGSGPHLGTALFAAAKVIESTGLPALGNDGDDWWHLQRFSRPVTAPLLVLATGTAARSAGIELAGRAAATGRPSLAVVSAPSGAGSGAAQPADGPAGMITLPHRLPSWCAPVADATLGIALAIELAERLARLPFEPAGAAMPESPIGGGR